MGSFFAPNSGACLGDRRILPPKRSRGQRIVISGESFSSKASLRRAIQDEIDPLPFGQIFRSDLISNLAHDRHPYCFLKDLRPTHFRKFYPQAGRSGYHFQAYFPDLGWRGLSWHKCLDPPTFHDEARGFLRWNLIPLLQEARGNACEQCGSRSQLEVHHADPTFQAMYDEASRYFSPEEIDTWAFYNWDSIPAFRLPPDHPVFRSFMEMHLTARLEILCKDCHLAATSPRSGR
jgi:hypothetical protein